MKNILVALFVTFINFVYGQDTLTEVSETDETRKMSVSQLPYYKSIGFELDALPYLSGGYYASAWYGVNHFRYRGVVANTQIPEFALCSCIQEHQLNAYAFIVDYFFKPQFSGWWVAAGYEYWDNWIIEKEETEQVYYSNSVITVGGGYVWHFWKGFYLNPWAAGHIIVSGNGPINMGDWDYYPRTFTPEVSLKLGYNFPVK